MFVVNSRGSAEADCKQNESVLLLHRIRNAHGPHTHCKRSMCETGIRHGTGADRGRSSQCLCWVYTSMFLNRPRSGSPRRLYSDLSCHIKDCQNAIYYLNFLKKNKNNNNNYIYIYILYLFGTRVTNRKIHTETVRYEYVYRYTPTIL